MGKYKVFYPVLVTIGVIVLFGGVVSALYWSSQNSITEKLPQQVELPNIDTGSLGPDNHVIGGHLEVSKELKSRSLVVQGNATVGTLTASGIVLGTMSGELREGQLFKASDGSIRYYDGKRTVSLVASAGLLQPTTMEQGPAGPVGSAGLSGQDGAPGIPGAPGGLDVVEILAGLGVLVTDNDGTITVAAPSAGTCPGCADASLSNLSGVALNTSLVPGTDGTLDLGDGGYAFRNGYINNMYSQAVHASSFDTASASPLSIGTTNATVINLAQHTTVASGKNLTANGAVLFQNATNSSAAFQVQNTAGAALLRADTTQGILSVGVFEPITIWSAAPVTKVNYAASNNPSSVTNADFNGDGAADFAAVNINSTSLSVFINNGTGSFAAKVDYSTGGNPRSVISADFNGDGAADLAVANWGPATLSVFINNGNGTFAAKVDYATGTRPYSITSADFNGDGAADLAVVNNTAATLSVFINNGNGTFAAKVDYATIPNPQSITSADFNGDGAADLAVTSTTPNTVSVFMNTGTGSFAAKVDYAAGTNPRSVTSADFNGDGAADLAVANGDASANTVSVFMNTGTGTFAAKVDYAAGTSPYSVISADFNGDGKADLAVAISDSNAVSVFMNNGNGTFQPKIEYSAGTAPQSVISADFNGDGKADLATANNSSNNVSVLLLGAMTGTAITQAPSKFVVNAEGSTVGQLIQGSSGQVADFLRVVNDLNATLFSVGATGTVTANGILNANGAFNANSTVLFKNVANSVTAFQVQQVNGTSVFQVDTSNGRVGIGNSTPGHKLSVNSLTTTAGNTTAQIALGTAAAANKGLIVQGVGSQTADLLQAQSSTGTVLASISASGTLTVTSAVISGTITINGHIITGGAAPSITPNTAACTAPTIAVTGNDTSGTVTITTGTGCSVVGTLATVIFNSAFGAAPRIIMTPANASGANLKYYNGTSTTTAFTVDTETIPTDSTTYKFNYWAVQ